MAFQLESATVPLRQLPQNTYLVHATNCIAQWGAGIAAELATIFPAACQQYKRFCNAAKQSPSEKWPPRSLAGKCLIIPPQESDVKAGAPRIYIVCLFTSYGFGRPNDATGKPGRDGVGKILSQTQTSLKAFREQLEAKSPEAAEAVIYSPLFNSGAFGVPWDKTSAVIKTEFDGWSGRWVVLTPPS
ncbi:ADP-ribose 1''-phosphate phosphatase [Pochonia chlamydosporia 170]|uniref:ADP-ribose 1''-phosphate phosphatase n=1 Tax=Pochonia chlamydosporia 170 TaxID=1380566 RepID=A0A179FEU8_METCM|nr:ADP-ribose 1''-phosphate phosphatase [Pochonia chlamydosporia 170]OAQ64054.1 ADP-ribose 1''-phosphate phosphatase [Pochonia chlamydosporia 170]